MTAFRYVTAAALGAALAAAPIARAQEAPDQIVPVGTLPITLQLCVLPAVHTDVHDATERTLPTTFGPGRAATATFQVTYNGFTPEAQAAFQAAVDIWAQHITSTVPIKVTANFTPLGTNILGSAGSNGLFANFQNTPIPATFYANALADAISGQPLDPNGQPGAVEINANFSSNFTNWYYGTDGNPAPSQYDFMTVVLHELGHGLGFFGRASVDDGAGSPECSGTAGDGCMGVAGVGLPVVYDRAVEDAAEVAVWGSTQYPTPSQALGTLLRSNQLYWDGPTVRAVLGGNRARLYAPATWTAGSSYSHLNENTYNNTENALMTYAVANGEVRHSPGPLTCAMFQDMGWPLGAGCQAIVPATATEPTAEAAAPATLRFVGPNPATAATALQVEVREAQAVRAELVDVTGRTVALLHDGPVAAGQAVRLAVDASALAPGVYVVRVAGERFATAERLVVAR